MKNFNNYLPTRLLFGPGELDNLHKQTLPGKKALLVISNGSSTVKNGYLDRTVEQLKKAGAEYVLFNGIGQNPLKSAVMSGAYEARENGCDFIRALVKLQIECGVADLKMSDYGIRPEEFEKLARNAKETMPGLFGADRYELTVDDCVNIYKEAYK